MADLSKIAPLIWHVPTVMLALLLAGLLMGQRHVGELSVFDLLTGFAISTVAGAGIADPDVPHAGILISILSLALLHYLVTWLTLKWKAFGRVITFEPIVVVRGGQPIRAAMRRVRLHISDLMPLLREKDVFDLKEVEYAILETNGKITVLKRQDPRAKAGLPRAVVLDGQIDRRVLQGTKWSEPRLIGELLRRGYDGPEEIFLATLDDAEDLYVVPKAGQDDGPVLHH